MSLIMTMQLDGDPVCSERYASEHPDEMGILEHAVQHGLIAHRFYGSDGKIMIIDEWPDAQSFQRVLRARAGADRADDGRSRDQQRAAAGVWSKLETRDDYG
jgi:hypothetical protein